MASISGETLSEFNVFMRSSPLGSKSLDRILSASDNPLKIYKLKVKDNYTNANAEILSARLKGIGLGLEFSTIKNEDEKEYPPETTIPITYKEYTIYDMAKNRQMYLDLFTEFDGLMRSTTFMESYPGEKHDWAWWKVFKNVGLREKYSLTDELKSSLIQTTKGRALQILDTLNPKPHHRGPSKKDEEGPIMDATAIKKLTDDTLKANAQDDQEVDDEIDTLIEDES